MMRSRRRRRRLFLTYLTWFLTTTFASSFSPLYTTVLRPAALLNAKSSSSQPQSPSESQSDLEIRISDSSSPSAEEADYALQTGDYSVLQKHHHHHRQEQQQQQDGHNWNVLKPNFRVAWDQHHQATVRLVRPALQHVAAAEDDNEAVVADQEESPTPPVAPSQQQQQQQQVSSPPTPEAPRTTNPVLNFFANIIQRKATLVSRTAEWKRLQKHAEYIQTTHLRQLMQDAVRSEALYATHDGVYLDYSRQRVTMETMKLLGDLAKRQDLRGKIEAMFRGDKINFTEDRAVLHTALRASRSKIGTVLVDDDVDAIQEVHDVLDQIKVFTNGVRSGQLRGYTGKRLRNIVSVGIGGSYLGPEFVHECLKTEPEGITAALGYNLRFLSNVDPVDVERTCADLDPEETLIVIVSKTFTTAETMLNAKTMRQWLWDFMGNDPEVVEKHMVACASISAIEKVKDFGIDTDNYFFRFWDWVGGRYSVCSAAGAVPISLLYGFELFEKFLRGAESMDDHFRNEPIEKNIPIIMGLLGVWNMSFLNYKSRTTLPYAEALLKLPAHIQQLDMESNGKTVTKNGTPVDYAVGEIDFGEAGTNGQHSFYQLLHMGQTVPCDFIGFCESQHDYCVDGESLSSHDELMANFFAQPDALATGKTADEVREDGELNEDVVAHRVFEGNRPSLSLLFPKLTAYACGQILALYEHRTTVQGFLWDINSFDQFGVELGKKLALNVKEQMLEGRSTGKKVDTGDHATTRLLNYYLDSSNNACGKKVETTGGNPFTRITRRTHFDRVQPPEDHNLRGHPGKLV
jgi:glucose-6-phosphate isomerase